MSFVGLSWLQLGPFGTKTVATVGSFTVLTQKSRYTLHHKVHIYIEYHSVCPHVGIGTPLTLLQASVPLHPTKGGHTCLRLTGWVSANSNERSKSLALCLLCALHSSLRLQTRKFSDQLCSDSSEPPYCSFKYLKIFFFLLG
jgi:hypothetical protein